MSSLEEEIDDWEDALSRPANKAASRWGRGIFGKERSPPRAFQRTTDNEKRLPKARKLGKKGKAVDLEHDTEDEERMPQQKLRAECVCSYCHGKDGNALNKGKAHNRQSCGVRLAGLPRCRCHVLEHGGCGDYSKKHDFNEQESRCEKCYEAQPSTIRSIDTSYQEFMTKWENIILDLGLVCQNDEFASETASSEALFQTGHLWKDHKDNKQNLKRGLTTYSQEHFRILPNTRTLEELEGLSSKELLALAKSSFTPCSGTEDGQRGRINVHLLDLIHLILGRRGDLKVRKPLLTSEELKESRKSKDKAVREARDHARAVAERMSRPEDIDDGWEGQHEQDDAEDGWTEGNLEDEKDQENIEPTLSARNPIESPEAAPEPVSMERTFNSMADRVAEATRNILMDDYQCREVLSLGLHRLLRLHVSTVNLDDPEQARAVMEVFTSPELDVRRSELAGIVTQRCPELFATSPILSNLRALAEETRNGLSATLQARAVKEDRVNALRMELVMAEDEAQESREEVEALTTELEQVVHRHSIAESRIVAQALLDPLPSTLPPKPQTRDDIPLPPPTSDVLEPPSFHPTPGSNPLVTNPGSGSLQVGEKRKFPSEPVAPILRGKFRGKRGGKKHKKARKEGNEKDPDDGSTPDEEARGSVAAEKGSSALDGAKNIRRSNEGFAPFRSAMMEQADALESACKVAVEAGTVTDAAGGWGSLPGVFNGQTGGLSNLTYSFFSNKQGTCEKSVDDVSAPSAGQRLSDMMQVKVQDWMSQASHEAGVPLETKGKPGQEPIRKVLEASNGNGAPPESERPRPAFNLIRVSQGLSADRAALETRDKSGQAIKQRKVLQARNSTPEDTSRVKPTPFRLAAGLDTQVLQARNSTPEDTSKVKPTPFRSTGGLDTQVLQDTAPEFNTSKFKPAPFRSAASIDTQVPQGRGGPPGHVNNVLPSTSGPPASLGSQVPQGRGGPAVHANNVQPFTSGPPAGLSSQVPQGRGGAAEHASNVQPFTSGPPAGLGSRVPQGRGGAARHANNVQPSTSGPPAGLNSKVENNCQRADEVSEEEGHDSETERIYDIAVKMAKGLIERQELTDNDYEKVLAMQKRIADEKRIQNGASSRSKLGPRSDLGTVKVQQVGNAHGGAGDPRTRDKLQNGSNSRKVEPPGALGPRSGAKADETQGMEDHRHAQEERPTSSTSGRDPSGQSQAKRKRTKEEKDRALKNAIKSEPDLSDYERTILQLVFCYRMSGAEILVSNESHELSREQLQRLKPTSWRAPWSREDLCLSDELMNRFYDVLNLQSRDTVVLNSVFLNKLHLNAGRFSNADEAIRWFEKRTSANFGDGALQLAKAVVAPVHWVDEHHWGLMVIDLKQKAVLYMDSCRDLVPEGKVSSLSRSLVRFIDKLDAGREVKLNAKKWPVRLPKVIQQTNSVDCGVLALYNAQMVVAGQDVTTARLVGTDRLRIKLLMGIYDFKLMAV